MIRAFLFILMSQVYQPQPGPQTLLLQTEADEVLAGGARGGGKTQGGIMWLMKGNYRLPSDHPVYETALNYSRYRALVVRREAQDLRDWVDAAWEIFRATGAEITGQPRTFVWPATGAKIYTDHLNDERAFNKYRGWNLHRILAEELTEIPFLKWYLRLFGSLRSKKTGEGLAIVPPQMLSTTNPDGPGHQWVRSRFIDLIGKGGVRIEPNTVVRDPISGLTRIFIPMRLEDNKYLDEDYEKRLKIQCGERGEGEATFLAWRYGRWDVFEGSFFPEFRPEGPMPGEPVEANHSYEAEAVDLAYWWPVAIGVDWGFNHESACYWGRHNQDDQRLYVEEEFVVRKLGSRQLGQEVAKRSIKYLDGLPDHHIPLFLSHDAFSKEDDSKTRAELFIMGIEDVLGPGSAHIAALTDSERNMAPVDAWASMQDRYLKITHGNCITVHQARQDRASMASYVRELLHWKKSEQPEPDIDFARRLLLTEDGLNKYETYMERFKPKQEVLPRVRIERGCARLKSCMSSLVFDRDNTEVPAKVDSTDGSPGDDPYDGFCHLVMGMRVVANQKPRSVFVSERLDWMRRKYGQNPDPALMQQILHKAHEDYDGRSAPEGPLVLHRM